MLPTIPNIVAVGMRRGAVVSQLRGVKDGR